MFARCVLFQEVSCGSLYEFNKTVVKLAFMVLGLGWVHLLKVARDCQCNRNAYAYIDFDDDCSLLNVECNQLRTSMPAALKMFSSVRRSGLAQSLLPPDTYIFTYVFATLYN